MVSINININTSEENFQYIYIYLYLYDIMIILHGDDAGFEVPYELLNHICCNVYIKSIKTNVKNMIFSILLINL